MGRINTEAEPKIIDSYAQGRSLASLAEEHGCCLETVRKVLKRNGINRRPTGGVYRTLDRSQLDELNRRWQSGESQTSIAISLGVSQCVVSRMLRAAGYNKENRRAAGERHGSWKGGRYTNNLGYVLVRVPPEDPLHPAGNRTTTSYMPEHRYVMAQKLGRPLRRTETVHHINGDRADNRVENLHLRSGRHGTGVALACSDCGSHNIVEAPLLP